MQSMSVIADVVGGAVRMFALSTSHSFFLPRSADQSLLVARGRSLSEPNVPNKIRLYWVGAWQKRNQPKEKNEQVAASGSVTALNDYLFEKKIVKDWTSTNFVCYHSIKMLGQLVSKPICSVETIGYFQMRRRETTA